MNEVIQCQGEFIRKPGRLVAGEASFLAFATDLNLGAAFLNLVDFAGRRRGPLRACLCLCYPCRYRLFGSEFEEAGDSVYP